MNKIKLNLIGHPRILGEHPSIILNYVLPYVQCILSYVYQILSYVYNLLLCARLVRDSSMYIFPGGGLSVAFSLNLSKCPNPENVQNGGVRLKMTALSKNSRVKARNTPPHGGVYGNLFNLIHDVSSCAPRVFLFESLPPICDMYLLPMCLSKLFLCYVLYYMCFCAIEDTSISPGCPGFFTSFPLVEDHKKIMSKFNWIKNLWGGLTLISGGVFKKYLLVNFNKFFNTYINLKLNKNRSISLIRALFPYKPGGVFKKYLLVNFNKLFNTLINLKCLFRALFPYKFIHFNIKIIIFKLIDFLCTHINQNENSII